MKIIKERKKKKKKGNLIPKMDRDGVSPPQ
jgi:hypothetical protein